MDIYDEIDKGIYKERSIPISKNINCPTEKCLCTYPTMYKHDYCPVCGAYIRKLINDKIEEIKEVKEEIRRCNQEKQEMFKKHLLEYAGLSPSNQTNKAFDTAWDLGHSNGLNEVVYHMLIIADIIKTKD